MLCKQSIRFFLVWFLAALSSSAASADRVPVETFAALPQIEGARLSPDGRRVAMIAARDGRESLRIWHSDGQVDSYMPAPDNQINWIAWKGNDRILMSLRATEFESGSSSRPIGLSRLVFVDTATRSSVRVAFREPSPPEHIIIIGRESYRPPNIQDRVISLLPADPNHILLSSGASGDWSHANALLIDVREGSPSVSLRANDSVVKWIADAQGQVRLKTTVDHLDDLTALTFWARDDEHS